MAEQQKKQQQKAGSVVKQPKKPQPKKATDSSKQKTASQTPPVPAHRVSLSLLLSVITLVAVLAIMVFLAVRPVANTSAVSTNGNTAAKNQNLSHGQWAVVNLSSGDHYYGRLIYDKSLGAYLLWNAWRSNTDSSTSTTSTATATYSRVGSELHKPLPYLVINPQVLYTWQDLSDSSSVLQAIKKTDGYAEVAEPKIADIKNAKFSAVFLVDDSVLFGTIVHNGTQIGVKNSYLMTRKDLSGKSNQPIKSLDDLQLVPQKNITPGSGDTLWVNPGALLMYETLSSQSPVSQAIQTK
ncbi:MAG: hypothetical protein FWF45_06135 [Coriobacteriia bacterium]|nr:hypothetical protein [Coriobacteriia bacterium]